MKAPRSFRRRIVVAFLVSGMALAALFAASVVVAVWTTEDAVLRRQLLAELEFLLERGPGEEKVIRLSQFMTAYVGLDSVPEGLRDRLATLGHGSHEIIDASLRPPNDELQVAVAPLPNRPEKLYLVFVVSAIEARRSFDTLLYTLLSGLASVTGLAVLLLFGLTTAVVRPLSDLARLVRSAEADELPELIHPERYDDEVRILVKALRDATLRVRGFIQREREFTGNASHELRTPLTVIKGATELIEASPAAGQPGIRRPLDRIRRSIGEMEETIEIFLELAREDSLGAAEHCLLQRVVEDVVERQRHLLADRSVEVEIQVPPDLWMQTSERAMSIVFGNVVANAFTRTEEGTVSIGWRDGGAYVTDSGPGIPGEDLTRVTERHFTNGRGGYGLGLCIAQTLCKRLGWGMEFERVEDGTTVFIRFDQTREPSA